MSPSETESADEKRRVRVEAANRYLTAMGYLEALAIICSDDDDSELGPRNAIMTLPVNMLAGFALELLFKAWLLASGKGSVSVRGYGHRLRSLFDEAMAFGLPNIDGLSAVVDDLAVGHQDFTFRYVNSGDEVRSPDWWLAFPALGSLRDAVEAHVLTW
jgi:hypothetical protein